MTNKSAVFILLAASFMLLGCADKPAPTPTPQPAMPLTEKLFYEISIYPNSIDSPTKISMYDEKRVRATQDQHSVDVIFEDGSDFDWNDINIKAFYAERTTPESLSVGIVSCNSKNTDRSEIKFTFDKPKVIVTAYSADPSTKPILFEANRTAKTITIPLWENCQDNVKAFKRFTFYDYAPGIAKPTSDISADPTIPPLPPADIENEIATSQPAGNDELPPLPM